MFVPRENSLRLKEAELKELRTVVDKVNCLSVFRYLSLLDVIVLHDTRRCSIFVPVILIASFVGVEGAQVHGMWYGLGSPSLSV